MSPPVSVSDAGIGGGILTLDDAYVSAMAPVRPTSSLIIRCASFCDCRTACCTDTSIVGAPPGILTHSDCAVSMSIYEDGEKPAEDAMNSTKGAAQAGGHSVSGRAAPAADAETPHAAETRSMAAARGIGGAGRAAG